MPATRIDNKTGSIRLTDPAIGSRFEIYNANTSGGLTNQYLLSGQAANADGLGNGSRAALLWGHTAGSLASYMSMETTNVSGVTAERMRIDSNGNVGIGTTNPQSVLDLGNATNGRSITWAGSTGANRYASIFTPFSASGVVLATGFHGSTSSDTYVASYTGTYKPAAIRLDFVPSGDGIKFYTDPAASFTAGNPFVPTERMRIDSSGNVTIPGNLYSPGTVVQVKTAISGPARQTIASTSPVAITGLSVNFTPKYSNSLIIVEANIASTLTYVTSFGVFRDGNKTVSTSGSNNEDGMQITLYGPHGTSANYMFSSTFKHFETSSNTNARTYAIYATSGWASVTYTLYINNRDFGDMPSFSTMTVTEVAQ